MIDDWFYEKNIEHSRNFKYGGTKMTADFFLEPNIVIDFFGLVGAQKEYDAIIQQKRSLCEKMGLVLFDIYPADLFPENRIIIFFD